ncbi:MAG: carbohydrate ABC transporter permease [Clostridia bacterium]|nr:carbohydrate ABC transporter permease [Clostridia bacterium]
MAQVVRKSEKVSKIIIHIFFVILSLIFIIPIWTLFAISITSDADIVNYGYQLIPKNVDWGAYKYIFTSASSILTSYKVTIIISAVGTFLSTVIGAMCAYTISRYDFAYRSRVTFYMFFTMLFGGGMVPSYILMTQFLHTQNTYWAMILPGMINVWNIFIMRTFFQQIPSSIIESATIDGASELKIFIKIIVPLSTPALATIGLLQLLGYWNAWMPAMLYVTKQELYPLQYLLQSMLRNMQEIMKNIELTGMMIDTGSLPMESMRMAMAVLAVGPILLIFPFFQKYFVQGLTVGSVKG